MKYEQPYGVSDTNAGYINGNPSTGTMGSIPPAASIENPQREIVNFETDSGLTPTDADLHQLSKSVQNGLVNYCADQGTPNFIAITPTPPISAYQLGQHFRIKVANANTGAAQVNVSNVGWAALVHGDKSAMGGGELFVGQMIDVAWDGAGNWQMMTGGLSGTLILMTAPRTVYIDAAIGNDTLYDGSQPTVDATNTHGPFLTLRHALSMMTKYNLCGFSYNINLANGTYTDTAPIDCPPPNGSGNIVITGNPSSPNAVKLVNSGSGTVLKISSGVYHLNGVALQATTSSPADGANDLWVFAAGAVWIDAVSFYGCPANHMLVGPGGGSLSIVGPIGIYGGGTSHMTATANGTINFWPVPLPTLNVYNPAPFSSAFIQATGCAQVAAAYAAINQYSVITGPRYFAASNGVIDSGGRGVSYLPGSVAGSTASGGQYV